MAQSARQKQWRLDNPEKVKQQKHRYYLRHKEEHKQRQARRDPEKVRAVHRNWNNQNPIRRRAIKARRKAREHGSGGRYTQAEWLALKLQYDNKCLRCGRHESQLIALGLRLIPDHVVALSKGGSNDI